MYHSITFGNMNTWDDWHLVPTSRPKFNTPSLKRKNLDISSRNGLLELSTSLTGYPVYGNREGSFEFMVMNDFKSWEEAYSDICDHLHGQFMRAVLEDDKAYYYEGIFTVNEWRSEKSNSIIVIDYSVAPYKVKSEATVMSDIPVTVINERYTFSRDFYGKAPNCPTLTVETTAKADMTVRFVNSTLRIDETKSLSNGTVQIPEFVFYGPTTYMYFQVPDTSMYLEDSTGSPIYDSSGNTIGTKSSGRVTVSCNQGRL